MVLSFARPAMHGDQTGSAGKRDECVIGDQHLVIAAQRLAAMVTDPVDAVPPVLDVALDAFP